MDPTRPFTTVKNLEACTVAGGKALEHWAQGFHCPQVYFQKPSPSLIPGKQHLYTMTIPWFRPGMPGKVRRLRELNVRLSNLDGFPGRGDFTGLPQVHMVLQCH